MIGTLFTADTWTLWQALQLHNPAAKQAVLEGIFNKQSTYSFFQANYVQWMC